MSHTLKSLIAASLFALVAGGAQAQATFPAKPVQMIVPFPAGGAGDILARALSDAFSKVTGQQWVIENRPGASGMIGTAACKAATADGYTYCLLSNDVMVINPFVFKKIAYDVERDFTVVTPLANLILSFVVNSSVPANNLKELAAWSQAHKDQANLATWGNGSFAHLTGAAFNKSMGASLTPVPYSGVPTMLTGLLRGDSAASLLFYGPIEGHLKEGKIKAIGILGEERYAGLPDVPTVKEQGFDFQPTVYFGVFAPAGAPSSTVARMSELIKQALADPAVQKIMSSQGYTPLNESPELFAERMARDRAVIGPIAKSLNLGIE